MAFTEDKAFELIKSAHERDRLGHAFIISGTKYAGVESLTTRVINLINRDKEKPGEEEASDNDMFDLFGEVEAGEVVSTDQTEAENLADLHGELVRVVRPQLKTRIIPAASIRELEKTFYKTARNGKYKVGVIVDADRMMPAAANIFLKTLEEPPAGSILFLLTSSPERLLTTVKSRCINIQLIAEKNLRETIEGEQEMLKTVLRNVKLGFNSISRALTIKATFASILNKRKLEIARMYEQQHKEELNHYKNTTDGEWLKDREKHYEFLAHGDYLVERSRFIDLLILCLGDLVRVKSCAPRLDLAQEKEVMAEVVVKESLESLMQRVDAMKELRALFETNVSESLALEVSFMKAFA